MPSPQRNTAVVAIHSVIPFSVRWYGGGHGEGHKEISESDGHVNYLDCHDG